MPTATVDVDIDLSDAIDEASDSELRACGLVRMDPMEPMHSDEPGAAARHERLMHEMQMAFSHGDCDEIEAAARAFFEHVTGEIAYPRRRTAIAA